MTNSDAYSAGQRNAHRAEDSAMADLNALVEAEVRRVISEIGPDLLREMAPDLIRELASETVSHETQGIVAAMADAVAQKVTSRPVVPAADPPAPAATSPTPDASRDRVEITDQFLAEVAKIYREAAAAGQPPTKALQDTFGKSRSSVSAWVRKAREAGHLPEAQQGRVSA